MCRFPKVNFFLRSLPIKILYLIIYSFLQGAIQINILNIITTKILVEEEKLWIFFLSQYVKFS
jgi:hypothetical protein